MKFYSHRLPLLLAAGLLKVGTVLTVAAAPVESPRLRQSFDAEWSFSNGDAAGAEQRTFEDSGWRRLDLPHDWSIEGPFDPSHQSGAPGGFLPGGTGWYRKSFKVPSDAGERRIFIEFDGIYMNGEVWINGHHLGKRPYGYMGVQYDLTPHLDPTGDNVLAVRVDNSRLPSGRWYTGSGIYRHVWLKITELLDIVGYNEGVESVFEIEGDRVRYPDRRMYLSEVPYSLQTRGEYRTHPRYYRPGFDHPKLTEKEVFPETDAHYESSYDNSGVQIDAQRSWRMTRTQPSIMGEFRWTGFDYIGESGGWPRVLGNYGIIDLCNFPKDTYYFYQSQWTDKPMVHLLPHWTWPGKEGTTIPVWCYTNCDVAELFPNGEALGTRKFDEKNDMHLEWLVPYQPGEVSHTRIQMIPVTCKDEAAE